MKLLFVNMTPFYHNTSANIRMCGVIAGASKNGHIVDLLTMRADEDDYLYEKEKGEFRKKYINNHYTFDKTGIYQSLKQKNNDANNRVLRSLKSIFKAIYRKFEIYDSQFVNVRNVLRVDIDFNQYDRIVSVSDPKSSNGIVYELIKNGKILNPEKKWIQYWGDPWLIDITKDYGWKKFLIKREEYRIISRAYRVVYTSPITMEEQKKIYKSEQKKMSCVNQAAKGMADRCQKERSEYYHKRTDQKVLIGYVGGYNSLVRNIWPLYKCCIDYGYSLDIIGDGDKEIKDNGTVRVINSLPQVEAEVAENAMDILVCLCNSRGTQIPGKIFYVAALKIPIIVIVDGERKKDIKNYLVTFERYIICDNDTDSIRHAIDKAIEDKQVNKVYTLSTMFDDTYCARQLLED